MWPQHAQRLVGNKTAETAICESCLNSGAFPGVLGAGSGQDMTHSQTSDTDHKVPCECGEPGPSLERRQERSQLARMRDWD